MKKPSHKNRGKSFPKVLKTRVAEIASKKMPFKEAQKWATSQGLVLKKNEDGEYVINFKGGKEATAYYTDDLADAIGTGEAMCKQKKAA